MVHFYFPIDKKRLFYPLDWEKTHKRKPIRPGRRRAQGELEAVQARYFDLFDLAPIGYSTVSEARLILDDNCA